MYRIPMYAHQHSHAFEIEIRERERAHTQGRKTMCLQEVSRSHTTKQPATTPSHIVFAMQFYTQFTVIYSSFIVIRVIVSDILTFPSFSARFSIVFCPFFSPHFFPCKDAKNRNSFIRRKSRDGLAVSAPFILSLANVRVHNNFWWIRLLVPSDGRSIGRSFGRSVDLPCTSPHDNNDGASARKPAYNDMVTMVATRHQILIKWNRSGERMSFVACDVHFDLMIRSHSTIQFRFDSIWFDFVVYFLFRRHTYIYCALMACIFSLHTHYQHRLYRNQYLYTYHTPHMQSILLIWFRWK